MNVGKEASLPVKKQFRPSFSPISGYDKPKETTYKSPQGFMTVFVQVIRTFSENLKDPKKNCSKKAIFPVKKDGGLFSIPYRVCVTAHQITYFGPPRLLTNFVEVKSSFQ